jgi:hypothetical protein
MPPEADHLEIKQILKRNTELLEENNLLLRRMRKELWIAFWLKVLWYFLLIGLPFALYFYVLEPYFVALGSSYEVFSAGMQEIPGWKQFTEAMNNFKAHTGE